MEQSELLLLEGELLAWNVDGSGDAMVEGGSWIGYAEKVTGRKRGRCSYSDCVNDSEVGGHIWISRVGCVIAPICKSCNWPENKKRWQGSGSKMRSNIVVSRTELTDGMKMAPRRRLQDPLWNDGDHYIDTSLRMCVSCKKDITSRPSNYTQCYNCWKIDNKYNY
ncbi:MAG: hypothetical protein CMB31_04890 [Euryarchaeota archaeon]|nr:hypothetical protein [Euryarchaeota archaeon]